MYVASTVAYIGINRWAESFPVEYMRGAGIENFARTFTGKNSLIVRHHSGQKDSEIVSGSVV